MAELTIRDFRKSDYQVFSEMINDFYNKGIATLHGIDQKKIDTIFKISTSMTSYARALMIEQDGKIAGYLHLSFTHSNEVAGMVVLIEELYIRPEYQGKGIGNFVLDWLFQEYQDKVKRFRLEVTRENDGATRLYRKKGFQPLEYDQMVYDLEEES